MSSKQEPQDSDPIQACHDAISLIPEMNEEGNY